MGRVAFYGLPDPKFFTDNITQNKLRFPKILGLYLYYCRICSTDFATPHPSAPRADTFSQDPGEGIYSNCKHQLQ